MIIKIINFIPLIAFFITYKMTSNMITATAVILGGCIIASVLEFLISKKISRMQIFLTVAVIIFGLPTILLNDPQIIKWKVTVVNFLLAGAIFVCQIILKKNPFSYLFGQELPLPEQAWSSMAKYWMVFFVFAGILNIIIAFCLPALIGVTEQEAESIWVDYKTFGNAILNFIFALACGLWIFKKNPELLKEAQEKMQNKEKQKE
ncbi:MAG: septation protein IspZ [Succinivibrio sp.]|nr:septation protein IspZ [Succinivibrio sp.]